jgi:hypothetical protein
MRMRRCPATLPQLPAQMKMMTLQQPDWIKGRGMQRCKQSRRGRLRPRQKPGARPFSPHALLHFHMLASYMITYQLQLIVASGFL